MLALSCFAIFQYDKSLWPYHWVQAADHCAVKLPTGPFVDKTPLRATDIVGHASLQKFRHLWWNIRPIETKFGMWKLKDSVYHSCESQSIITNKCVVLVTFKGGRYYVICRHYVIMPLILPLFYIHGEFGTESMRPSPDIANLEWCVCPPLSACRWSQQCWNRICIHSFTVSLILQQYICPSMWEQSWTIRHLHTSDVAALMKHYTVLLPKECYKYTCIRPLSALRSWMCVPVSGHT